MQQEGESSWVPSCSLLSADGSRVSGVSVTPPTSDSDYRSAHFQSSGKVTYQYFVRGEPGSEVATPGGDLALEVEVRLDDFDSGSARFDSFVTRDGTTYLLYTWAEKDCEAEREEPPQWVFDKAAE